jgi:hypothetical protein
MKISYFGILGFFAVVTLGCKSKPKQGVDAGVTEVPKVEIVGEVKKTEEVKKEKLVLSPEKRAEKTGFAKYLPADTEMLLSVYQAKDSFEKIKALKLVGAMMDQKSLINAEVGLGADELPEDEQELEVAGDAGKDVAGEAPKGEVAEASGVWTLLGQEVTVAFGKTSGEQMGNLLKLNERVSFFQAAAIGKAVQALMKNGNMEEFGQSLQGGSQEKSFMKFLEDPESGMSLLNKTAFPPMYIAFRAKEGELEQAARMVSSSMAFFGMAGEMAVPVEIQTAGSGFVGYKLLGAKMAELISENRESMEKNMKPETVDALLATLSNKNMVFATGTIGDYVVLMIGGDEASLQLVNEPKDSLGADKKMSFVDEFSDKPFLTVSYGDQAALKSLIQQVGGVASYGLGFREGLSGGEMRDIQELLQLFAEREKALLALGTTHTFGMVAYSDEGLKIDSLGGHDKGAMDWSAPTRLAHLGDHPDHLFFLNYSSNAAYSAQLKEYLELIGETAYAMALKFSALEIEDPKILEMKGYLKLFDADFREDMLALYQAASGDLMDGMGQETVFLMDMKGAMPALPGIPQEIVNEGKAPRLAMITPVTDRAKIAKSWDKINTHSTALLAKVSEMTQKKIPMQKPISSEKDGMVTWFVSMPFFQDDFLPSVTLNDKWFVASTSKVQAIDLIAKAEAGGESGQGVKFRMNFKVLGDYSEEMFKVMDRHMAQLIQDETARGRFNANKDSIKKMIDATREFDSMTWDVRKEEGLVRSRIHFKMN